MKKNDSPVIKLFVKNNHFYCYDAYSNILFSFDRDQYEEAQKLVHMGITAYSDYASESRNTAAHDILFLLNSDRYFAPELFSESQYVDLDVLPFLYERGINDLVLQVTKDCNFSCRYCQFAADSGITRIHENKNMSITVAKQAIDFTIKHSADSYNLNIAFYGGEPLLNIELIKEILEYIADKYPFKLITYNMTTNASLLNDDNIRILKKYNVNINVSFDGPEQVQNYNRKFKNNGNETFDIVNKNIRNLRENHKEYFDKHVTFHSVILNKEQRISAIEYFEGENIDKDRYRVVSADLSGIDYYDYCGVDSDTYSKHQSMGNSFEWYNSRLNCYDLKYRIPQKTQHGGPCIPGIRRLFVNLEGKFYICEKAIENDGLSIGSLEKGIDVAAAGKLLNLGKLTDDECKKCFAFRFCSICAANCIDPLKGCITAERKKIECGNQKKLAIDFLHKYVECRKAKI